MKALDYPEFGFLYLLHIPIIFNRPPEIVITAEVAEVVSEVVQLVFDPVRVGVKSVWHLKANHPHLD